MCLSFRSLLALVCLAASMAVAGPSNAETRAAKLKKGEVVVISGLDGRILERLKGAQKGDEFGSDVGFDALPGVGLRTNAWAVGAPGGAGGNGRFFALDADTGRRLWWVDGSTLAGGAVERFGESIVDLGHINGDTPVDWAAADGELVHTVMLIVSPTAGAHLDILAQVGRTVQSDEALELLRSQPSESALLEGLRGLIEAMDA